MERTSACCPGNPCRNAIASGMVPKHFEGVVERDTMLMPVTTVRIIIAPRLVPGMTMALPTSGVTPARVRDWLPEPCREPQTRRRARSPDQQFNPRPGAFAGAVGFPPPEEFQGNHAGWGCVSVLHERAGLEKRRWAKAPEQARRWLF